MTKAEKTCEESRDVSKTVVVAVSLHNENKVTVPRNCVQDKTLSLAMALTE